MSDRPARDDPGVSGEELWDIIRLLPDVLFRCYKEDGKIYWSLNEGGLAEEFGLTTKDVEGKSLDELFPGGASSALHEHFELAFEGTSTIFTNEIEGRHFRHFPKPVYGDDGQVKEVIGFIAEVTDLVKTQEALAAANQDLEAFVRGISHDLRNPLGALSNLLQVVSASKGTLPDPAGRAIDQMQATVRRTQTTIDGLLRLTRAAQGDLRCEPVDVGALAKEVVRDLRARNPERNVEVEIEDDLVIESDEDAVYTILHNILANSWKYTAEEERPRIVVRGIEGGFAIDDNGVGFPKTAGDEIFDPFVRAHGDDYEGTGIGLATVKRIVDRQAGTIEAKAGSAGGACMEVRLP